MSRVPDERLTVLVTGAAGVVGSLLVRELHGKCDIVALAHKSPVTHPDVITVHGDMTKPRLGLARAVYGELARRVDVVVHSAGLTNFSAPIDRHRTSNVVGTERVLEFVLASGAALHHVSTAYAMIAAPEARVAIEPSNVIHAYVTTKHQADDLVRASGVAASLYRPSNVIGDSRTGEISRSQMVPRMANDLLRSRYPFVPARPSAVLDLVPADVCGDAIARSVLAGTIGADHWLTYGKDSLSISEIVDVVAEFGAEIGRSVRRPLVVDPDDEEAVAAALAQLPARLRLPVRVMYSKLLGLSDALTAGGTFPSSLPLLAERHDLPIPDLRDALKLGLRFVVANGRRRRPTLARA